MAKSYVEFEVSKELKDKTLEALRLVRQSQTGKIRKGVNEVTKSLERGLSKFVVIAEDVDPEEVVKHIPMLCKQKNVPFTYVSSKQELGKAIGLNVNCSVVSLEDYGSAESNIKDVISKVPVKQEGK
ncbi:MAG: 50S ribosomal protein L7Ae [Candidatus Micrarchaeaceae archaeon]